MGLAPSPLYPQTPWISPQGISMEPNGRLNGGFSAGYGDLAWQTDRLAEVLAKAAPEIGERATNVTSALAYLRYPDNCQDLAAAPSGAAHFPGGDVPLVTYRCMRLESAITWRHNKNPGVVSYGGGAGFYGALVAKNPAAVRLAQLRMEHGDVFSLRVDTDSDASSPHFPVLLADAVRLQAAWQSIQGLSTSYRLPFETASNNFAWVDPAAMLVSAQYNGERLFIALQWRHGFNTNDPGKRVISNVVLNDVARVHHATPRVDRIAIIPLLTDSPQRGFLEIQAVQFGPFIFAMHTGLPQDGKGPLAFVPPANAVGRAGCDLRTGNAIESIPGTLQLSEQEWVAIKVGNC